MKLRREYPEYGFQSGCCFVLFAAGLAILVFWADRLRPGVLIALGSFAVGMAVLGSTFWLAQLILEVGFHLRERIQETSRPVGQAPAPAPPPGPMDTEPPKAP